MKPATFTDAKRVDPTLAEALASVQNVRFPRVAEHHQHDTRVFLAQIMSAFAPKAGGK